MTTRHTARHTTHTLLALVGALSSAGLVGCLSHTRDTSDAGPLLSDALTPTVDTSLSIGDAPSNACEPMDANGVGGCEAELGYVWHGNGCRSISGCDCVGRDCASLYETVETCIAAHTRCPRACGESFGGPLPACFAGEFCSYPPGCGFDDGLGVCAPRPTRCDPSRLDREVCGCDGVSYLSECEANEAGTSVNRVGACPGEPSFTSPMMRASCGPADGPAWDFTLTSTPVACETEPALDALHFELWHQLDGAPEQTYTLRDDFSADGRGRICSFGECDALTGTVTVRAFTTGEVTRFDYDLLTVDGRRFRASNVEGTSWCRVLGPGCG